MFRKLVPVIVLGAVALASPWAVAEDPKPEAADAEVAAANSDSKTATANATEGAEDQPAILHALLAEGDANVTVLKAEEAEECRGSFFCWPLHPGSVISWDSALFYSQSWRTPRTRYHTTYY